MSDQILKPIEDKIREMEERNLRELNDNLQGMKRQVDILRGQIQTFEQLEVKNQELKKTIQEQTKTIEEQRKMVENLQREVQSLRG